MKPFLLALFTATAAADANWPRLPLTEHQPVNLASASICGTSIHSNDGLENAESLLSEDATAAATIRQGRSHVVIHLAAQQVVEAVRFMNDGLDGSVSLLASPDDKNWIQAQRVHVRSSQRTVELHFAGALARYVKLQFELNRGGGLRTFKLYGLAHDDQFSAVRSDAHTCESGGDHSNDVNWASGLEHARAIYAFPKPINAGLTSITENLFQFPRSPGKYCTIVYDLGCMRDIRRISTAYSMRPARLDVFAFENLPEARDWRGIPTLDPAIFGLLEPVASGEDSRGVGHIKRQPGTPVMARYVALRYQLVGISSLGRASEAPARFGDRRPSLHDLMTGEIPFIPVGGDFLKQTSDLNPFGPLLDLVELVPFRKFVRRPLPAESALDPGTTDTGVFEATVEISDHGYHVTPQGNSGRGTQGNSADSAPIAPYPVGRYEGRIIGPSGAAQISAEGSAASSSTIKVSDVVPVSP